MRFATRTRNIINRINGRKPDSTTTGTYDPTTLKQLVFPRDVLTLTEGNGHYILFNINTVVGSRFSSRATRVVENTVNNPFGDEPVVQQSGSSSLRTLTRNHVRSDESIVMFMPPNLSTAYNVDWSATELGVLGSVLADGLNFDSVNLEDVKRVTGRLVKETALNLASLVGVNAEESYRLYSAETKNPFTETLFNGISNRTLPLNFRMNARSENEAETIKEIVRRFKFHAAPEIVDGDIRSSYFKAPSTFDITFMNKDQNNVYLHRMSTCALSDINVNYTPNGEYSTLKNGAPTQIELELKFTELEVLTKSKFLDPDNSF